MVTGKAKAYGVFALVFALGAATGGGAALAWAHERRVAQLDNDHEFESRRLRALSRKLDLDADQEARIGSILAKDHDESRRLGRDIIERCGQPLRDHKTAIDAEIRAVLRPEQQERFDKLAQRHHVSLGRFMR